MIISQSSQLVGTLGMLLSEELLAEDDNGYYDIMTRRVLEKLQVLFLSRLL